MNKDLTAASALPLLLGVLSKGESYGYAIIKSIRERSGGLLAWTEGMLYPVLHRAEAQGLIVSRWEAGEGGRKRKYYGLTEKGRAVFTEELAQWRAVDSAIEEIAGGAGHG